MLITAESFNAPRATLMFGFIGTDPFDWNIGWDVTVALSSLCPPKGAWEAWVTHSVCNPNRYEFLENAYCLFCLLF